MDQLRARIGEQIRDDLKKPRYPCYCRFLTRASQNKWHLKAVNFFGFFPETMTYR